MYVDGLILLAIYLVAVLALALGVYSLWTLKEVEELYKRKNSKPGNAWDHYHNKAKQKPRAKGPWK